jgi:Protein of unknown function (DUF4240)
MDRDRFWALMEAARSAGGGCHALAARLVGVLSTLPPQEIVSFQGMLDELMAESFRWDVKGAAVLINVGITDDGFEDFRGWLIGQGREVYEAALRDPDSLAQHPQMRDRDPERAWQEPLECEALLYSANRAYAAATGEDLSADLPWPPRDRGSGGASTIMPSCADATLDCGPLWAGVSGCNLAQRLSECRIRRQMTAARDPRSRPGCRRGARSGPAAADTPATTPGFFR